MHLENQQPARKDKNSTGEREFERVRERDKWARLRGLFLRTSALRGPLRMEFWSLQNVRLGAVRNPNRSENPILEGARFLSKMSHEFRCY